MCRSRKNQKTGGCREKRMIVLLLQSGIIRHVTLFSIYLSLKASPLSPSSYSFICVNLKLDLLESILKIGNEGCRSIFTIIEKTNGTIRVH